MFQIPDNATPEQRELLEEIMAHPELFRISDDGYVTLAIPKSEAIKIPAVAEAMKALDLRRKLDQQGDDFLKRMGASNRCIDCKQENRIRDLVNGRCPDCHDEFLGEMGL